MSRKSDTDPAHLQNKLFLKRYDFDKRRFRPLRTKHCFVLFADILGASEGMLRHPNIDATALGLMPYMAESFALSKRTCNQIPTEHLTLVRFHYLLNRVASSFYPWDIIAFADSAYIVLDKPEPAAHFSVRLMNELMTARIPARIGIGAGTFAILRFDRQEAVGRNYYAAQFAGSAVVRAYRAESKGGKGLRIFVHPSAGSNFSHNGNVSWFLKRLPERSEYASHEVDYTWWRKAGGKSIPKWLRAQYKASDEERVRVHYSETIAAFQRFNGRR